MTAEKLKKAVELLLKVVMTNADMMRLELVELKADGKSLPQSTGHMIAEIAKGNARAIRQVERILEIED